MSVSPQVVCPSGLRGGTQVAIASAAQVRTLPQLQCFFPGLHKLSLVVCHERVMLEPFAMLRRDGVQLGAKVERVTET